ncbi:MAG: SDR family oxidoreductase [Anaerolineae bacterium]|nr:SDR family oxidoreductase [Anaerolineae bacterium]
MRLKGKVAVVTGAAQGIGAGIALRLAQEGAAVVIADIDEGKAARSATEIAGYGAGAAIPVVCDVSNAEQVDALFRQALENFGRVDILVNNAALVHHPGSNVHFLEVTDETWQRALAINLTGLFYCSQRAARIMVRQTAAGMGTGGAIINIGSGGGSRAHRQLMVYDTTKGGLEAATRSMALDLAPWKIRVNTLVPGNTEVEHSRGGAIGPEFAEATIPLGYPATPADIGAAAAFLASDDAAYITGQRLIVDGGMDAQLRSPGVDTKIDPAIADRI